MLTREELEQRLTELRQRVEHETYLKEHAIDDAMRRDCENWIRVWEECIQVDGALLKGEINEEQHKAKSRAIIQKMDWLKKPR